MTQTRAQVRPTLVILALTAALGAYAYTTQTNAPERQERTVVRVEVTVSRGVAHVVHTDISSAHGPRTHTDGDYSRTYARDVVVSHGEVVRTLVTVAVDIDVDNRRTLECLIKENGKVVEGPTRRTVRAGFTPHEPVTCSRTTRG